jgi:integrase
MIDEQGDIVPPGVFLVANRKKRKRLTTEAFWAIHDHEDTPLFLKVAMQQSLVTLQSRQQISNTRLSDYSDGYLYYIRQKTARDTDMAFIKIKITMEIDQIRRLAVDNIVSPYLVHKSPLRRDPERMAKKPHWTYIYPEELGRAFSKARDKTRLYDDWLPAEKPGFHDIRSLGGRMYNAMDYPKEYIQGLMTHTDMKTTEIYLSDPGNLKPEHFREVEAGLTLASARHLKL